MADIKDFKHAIVRQKILDAVRKDLIGPTSDCEQLNEVPTSSYITGLLYPADTDVTEDENYNDVEFTEKNFDADGETLEAGIFEEEEAEDRVKGGFQKPSSIGVSFYVSDDVQKVNAYINWGKYYAEQVQGEVIDETLEEDAENKKKKKHTIYIREQMNDVVEIDFNLMGRSKQIPLESNGTLIRLYSIILQTALDIAKEPEYEDYIDPYYTLIGYFNSIRELGGAVRLLDDDIASRIRVVKNKYNSSEQRYLSFEGKKEITSRIPSWDIAQILEKLAISYDKNKEKQGCYDVVIATNMIAVGMDVDRLGLMSVVGQPKQNSEYIQATSRVGRQHPGIIFTVYNPYRPRDLSNYENFVGFHSQMYRYVEGTTATPFAARARDRVLHALVVSLLRLQVETMADNGGASNINDISDEQIKDIKDKILERVKITAPSSYVDTEKEMDEFINTWKNIAKDEKLYYFVPAVADDKKRLLTYYGEYYGDKEKPTLNSMRDVEQSSTVFYWEGV